VANAEKVLSLYERDLHVIVRGKAEAEVEFGNTLWVGEQVDGLILDWQLLKDQTPATRNFFGRVWSRSITCLESIAQRGRGSGPVEQNNERWLRARSLQRALSRGVRNSKRG